MRLLDRYLLRELFIPLGYCLCGFLIFFIAFDLIGSLNKFQENALHFSDVLDLYVVKIPGIFVFMLPITLLLSLLYALTNMARSHELTAMRAAGISLARICLPYLAVGFILSLVTFALNELWVPDSEARQIEIMDRRVKKNAVVQNPATQALPGLINDPARRTWLTGPYNFNTDVVLDPVVIWEAHGGKWRLAATRAEYHNEVWRFYGATVFSPGEISDPFSLAVKLKHPATNDALSQYLTGEFLPATRALLENYIISTNQTAVLKTELQSAFANEFNRISRQGELYDAQRFSGVRLTPETQSLLVESPRGTDLIILNRELLTDAFPREISHSWLYTVKLDRSDSSSGFQYAPVLSTNFISMPEFNETPADFKSEAKFSRRSVKLTADGPEIPIVELQSYLKLHPNTAARNALRTQLHGRYASPWKCLVVVLIAIPFGAPSGRRNIFVGVASSIVICFAYFILLQLSLALGTGGFLPGWVAAWLPNAIFSIAAFVMILRVR